MLFRSADHRLAQYADLAKYPVDSTRFHPTFAYEMVLNVLAFLFIMWYARREEEPKPGTLFSMWLIAAGFIRTFIEFFRPDQPRLGDTFITTSMLVAFLMGVTGVILFLARYGKIQIAALSDWEEEYFIKKVEKKSSTRTRKIEAAPAVVETEESEAEEPVVKRKSPARAKATTEKKATTKKAPAKRKKAE